MLFLTVAVLDRAYFRDMLIFELMLIYARVRQTFQAHFQKVNKGPKDTKFPKDTKNPKAPSCA